MEHGDVTAPARVLVTGADGRIGRPVVAALLRSGSQVTALSPEWEHPCPADRRFTGSASDEGLVAEALEGADAVVHLGAIPHPSLGSAREVFTGNTSATFTVLDAAGAAGVRRAVIASSINASGVPMNRHDVMPDRFPLDEEARVDHEDPYSLSKWVDEQTARWAHRHWGMDIVALRLPHVAELPHLRDAAGKLRKDGDERARLVREGWSYLRLADAAEAVRLGLGREIAGVHVLMIAAPDTLLDEETESALDRYAPGVPRTRVFRAHEAPLSLDRLESVLGWRPRLTLDDP